MIEHRLRALLILAAIFVTAGCGAGQTPTATSRATATPPGNVLTAPTAIPVARTAGTLLLATTTSTQDSGLLTVILPVFEKQYNAKVNVVAVGTGQALKIGSDGNADVVLVHARKLEDEFVAAGHGINRRDVMYNDFVVVGPVADPARVTGLKSAAEAFKKVSELGSAFASRGDKSGTNTKELEIWSAAGVAPRGTWYLSVGQGMGETLTFAHERGAYTLTDRATWLAQKSRLPGLVVVVGGNSIAENADAANLFNPYGVIPVNPKNHPTVNADLAEKFAQWLTSAETQTLIGQFGIDKYGQSLFQPSAQR